MTYEQKVEAAVAANDIEALVKFAYGYPCKCKKIKGEPMCVCKMQAKALREKIVPLPLFSGKIERVKTPSKSTAEPAIDTGSIKAFWRR